MTVLGFQPHDVKVLLNLVKLNLRDRYLGSVLGAGWAVIQPLALLALYTFVFGFVFKAKLPGADTTLAFTIWLISGYVPYLAVSESFSMTSNSVVAGASLVKNIVFKSEILPLAATMLSGVPFAVGIAVLLALLVADGNYPTVHLLALFPVIAVQFAFLAGLGFFLAATTVFVRDIAQVIPTMSMLILFFSPIFYSIDMMPRQVRLVTFFNPIYHIVQPYRDILIDHRLPDPWGMLYLASITAIVFVTGLTYFRRLKGYFEMAL